MFVDELVIATGWGSDDVPSKSGGTRQLKELNMKVWANEDCDKAMKMFGTDKQPIQYREHICVHLVMSLDRRKGWCVLGIQGVLSL